MNFESFVAFSCWQVADKFLSKAVISWRYQFANKCGFSCYNLSESMQDLPATIQTFAIW